AGLLADRRVSVRLRDACIEGTGGAHGRAVGGAGVSAEVLTVSRLVKRYHETPAVNDVSFSVAPGEIFGLLGANGAGKSTLLKCTLGLVRPTSGEIVVDGLHANRQPLET